jgi:hypothetical protein
MIRFEPIRTPKSSQVPQRCVRSLEERMADDMRELAFAGRNVSTETLLECGWTRSTIKRLGPVAVEIARRKSTRQVAQ